MNRRFLAALLALATLAGCGSGTSDPPTDPGVLRFLHAIPELDTLTMTYDGQELGGFGYTELKGLNRPGDGRHDVEIDVRLPGDDAPFENLDVRTAVARAQTFVLTGTLEDHEIVSWEEPARDWVAELDGSGEVTELEVSFGHASRSYGTVDVYLGEEDLDPAEETPVATLSYGDMEPALELESGEHEIVVATAGDPADVLFRTGGLTLPSATSIMFVLFDGAELIGGQPRLLMRSMGPGFSGILVDVSEPARLRAVHSAKGTGKIEVRTGTNDDVIIPEVAYGTASDYIELNSGSRTLSFAKVADPDDELDTQTINPGPGTDLTVLVAGEPDQIVSGSFSDDHRSVITHARFRVINGADTFGPSTDVYLVEPGASIEDELPVTIAVFLSATGYIAIDEGDYDMILTPRNGKEFASGRIPVSLVNGGVYTVVVLQGDTDDSLETLLLDDFIEP
jgi:hypothetical protein